MKKTGILVAIALMTSTGAMAADDQPDAAKEKKVCKSQKITGSLTKVNRVCKTQAQWDEQERLAKQGLDRTVGESNRYVNFQNAPGPGGPAS